MICNVYHFLHLTFLQLKILGMLPALASHYGMIPLVVQTIMPMLQKDSKPYVEMSNHPMLLSFFEKFSADMFSYPKYVCCACYFNFH